MRGERGVFNHTFWQCTKRLEVEDEIYAMIKESDVADGYRHGVKTQWQANQRKQLELHNAVNETSQDQSFPKPPPRDNRGGWGYGGDGRDTPRMPRQEPPNEHQQRAAAGRPAAQPNGNLRNNPNDGARRGARQDARVGQPPKGVAFNDQRLATAAAEQGRFANAAVNNIGEEIHADDRERSPSEMDQEQDEFDDNDVVDDPAPGNGC
jgi:hypothetical protein